LILAGKKGRGAGQSSMRPAGFDVGLVNRCAVGTGLAAEGDGDLGASAAVAAAVEPAAIVAQRLDIAVFPPGSAADVLGLAFRQIVGRHKALDFEIVEREFHRRLHHLIGMGRPPRFGEGGFRPTAGKTAQEAGFPDGALGFRGRRAGTAHGLGPRAYGVEGFLAGKHDKNDRFAPCRFRRFCVNGFVFDWSWKK